MARVRIKKIDPDALTVTLSVQEEGRPGVWHEKLVLSEDDARSLMAEIQENLLKPFRFLTWKYDRDKEIR